MLHVPQKFGQDVQGSSSYSLWLRKVLGTFLRFLCAECWKIASGAASEGTCNTDGARHQLGRQPLRTRFAETVPGISWWAASDILGQPLRALVTQTVLGIILGGGAGSRLYPLTKKRAKPAVPLGANYRLIDIPVSNCINSNVNKIYCLTQVCPLPALKSV